MCSKSPGWGEVEATLQRERRAAAVARTAARVAGERSLPATLRALAHEILQVDGLAAVQVFTNEHSGDKLHMLGIAGFPGSARSVFFSRLMECKRRGADLRMLEAFHTGRPVVIPHRYEAVMNNPAWQPLHEYHRYPVWDSFASIPIKVRESTIGILNAFFAPGKDVDQDSFDFLLSMAEQAGLAIDYAFLLEQERNAIQREERQRLARDLHDSVVQNVFSMRMLTQTLKVLSNGDRPEHLERIQEITTDLEGISESVLKDLRGLVTQLRPTAVSGAGLRDSLNKLTSSIHRQTGVSFDITLGYITDEIEGEFAEDIYHVIAEAVHNAVKHSSAERVTISLDVDPRRTIQLYVRDDGGGLKRSPSAESIQPEEGNGLTFMRQRVERWQGVLFVDFDFGGIGTLVRVELPYQKASPELGRTDSREA
ncbi:GAF domain-containing sensor histidine kinase [Nesterenkonia haasae]|uniref:GAF domain-containing sensor histidine kinase n=1 Tax=Nesterenkonia haasae TaxID=2587813 RepID=UPI001391C838|nr:GAF domain-containing sensor histidine kinase [Nesterenkonia haasae]NDK31957.1 GAF domain-containing sensor histidine kinase [Nesterenkonia haasae]